MIILITGASHTGKTVLSQMLIEKLKFPCFSIDHLKMGLIRSGQTKLTPEDDAALTPYLWPIVREIIKTAVENLQNLIVEGCYVPFDWRNDFDAEYQSAIRFICLAMTERYIESNFGSILANSCRIERRLLDTLTMDELKKDNAEFICGFKRAGERIFYIDCGFDQELQAVLNDPCFDPGLFQFSNNTF